MRGAVLSEMRKDEMESMRKLPFSGRLAERRDRGIGAIGDRLEENTIQWFRDVVASWDAET